MSDSKKIRDTGASVRARLLNLAQQQGQAFDLLLTRYAIERLLHRLSISVDFGFGQRPNSRAHALRFLSTSGLVMQLNLALKKLTCPCCWTCQNRDCVCMRARP